MRHCLSNEKVARTAVEIGLDKTDMEDKLGNSIMDQRERRNRVRTWML